MIKTSDKTIGGMHVYTTQFPAMTGFTLLARLLKNLAPLLGSLGELDPQAEIDFKAVPLLAEGLSKLDPTEATEMLGALLKSTYVIVEGGKGKQRKAELSSEAEINAVFSGKLKVMLEVAVWVIQENFADFFAGSGRGEPAGPTPGDE